MSQDASSSPSGRAVRESLRWRFWRAVGETLVLCGCTAIVGWVAGWTGIIEPRRSKKQSRVVSVSGSGPQSTLDTNQTLVTARSPTTSISAARMG